MHAFWYGYLTALGQPLTGLKCPLAHANFFDYPIWYYVVALVAAHRFRGCDFRVCAARTVVRLRKKSSYNVSTNLYALEGAPTFTELIELVQTEFVFTEAMKITQCYIFDSFDRTHGHLWVQHGEIVPIGTPCDAVSYSN
jgi:hypothetical protein